MLTYQDLAEVAAAPGKLFALSKRGRLYAVSADRSFQEGNVPSRAYWKRLASRDPGVDYVELQPNVRLGWGEKWTSISVGSNHLLALTNKGRTFSLPLNPAANSHRQLGTRQTFPVPATMAEAVRDGPTLPPASDPRFETKLTEIPALSGIRIAQIAASDRSSFVRTADGKVLGFGANDYGQIGLGNRTTVATIPTPVEIAARLTRLVLASRARTSRPVVRRHSSLSSARTATRSSSTSSRAVTARMERSEPACGPRLATSPPRSRRELAVRAFYITDDSLSGLQEYSEATQELVPLQITSISVSPSMNTHAFAVLDTLQSADPKGKKQNMFGKDVLVWGGNSKSFWRLGGAPVADPQSTTSSAPVSDPRSRRRRISQV